MPFSVTLLVPGVAERMSAEVPELGHPAATSSPTQDWEEACEFDVLCASANPVQSSVALTIVRKCFFISCDSPSFAVLCPRNSNLFADWSPLHNHASEVMSKNALESFTVRSGYWRLKSLFKASRFFCAGA